MPLASSSLRNKLNGSNSMHAPTPYNNTPKATFPAPTLTAHHHPGPPPRDAAGTAQGQAGSPELGGHLSLALCGPLCIALAPQPLLAVVIVQWPQGRHCRVMSWHQARWHQARHLTQLLLIELYLFVRFCAMHPSCRGHRDPSCKGRRFLCWCGLGREARRGAGATWEWYFWCE